MNRTGLAIVLEMGVLTLLLWWLVNRPGMEPPWPAEIAGVSFSPTRGEQDPTVGKFPSIAEIDGNFPTVGSCSPRIGEKETPAICAGQGGSIPGRLTSHHKSNVNMPIDRTIVKPARFIRCSLCPSIR